MDKDRTETAALSLATARFVAQLPSRIDSAASRFEQAIDDRLDQLLRRLGSVTMHPTQADMLVEVRAEIEYGPFALSMDHRRLMLHLKRELAIVASSAFDDNDLDLGVFNINRRMVAGPDLTGLLDMWMQSTEDVNIPMKTRHRYEAVMSRVNKQLARVGHDGTSGQGRIDWIGDRHLDVVKQLSATIRRNEKIGRNALWKRMHELCAPIIQAVLGEADVTFALLLERHSGITPAKLAQRADHVDRFGESSEIQQPVERAYQRLIANGNVSQGIDADDDVLAEAVQ